MADGSSGIAGDWAKLAMMRQRVGDAADGSLYRALLVDLAAQAEAQILTSFATATDPYGAAWRRRKRQGDGHPLLEQTGRLEGSIRVRVMARGLSITSPVVYAAAHQYGHTYPPQAYTNAHGRDGRFRSHGRNGPYARRGVRMVTIGTTGPRELPARPWLPDEARGLGRWEQAFDRAAAHKLTAHFGLAA